MRRFASWSWRSDARCSLANSYVTGLAPPPPLGLVIRTPSSRMGRDRFVPFVVDEFRDEGGQQFVAKEFVVVEVSQVRVAAEASWVVIVFKERAEVFVERSCGL